MRMPKGKSIGKSKESMEIFFVYCLAARMIREINTLPMRSKRRPASDGMEICSAVWEKKSTGNVYENRYARFDLSWVRLETGWVTKLVAKGLVPKRCKISRYGMTAGKAPKNAAANLDVR